MENRKLAAIMFTDIVGFSQKMGEDENHALQSLDIHNKLLEQCIEDSNGHTLKHIGDSIFAEFESANNAVNCAIDIQTKLSEYNSDKSTKDVIAIRIGIHLGDVVIRDDDLFGDGINIASRLEPLAEPGGICISQEVYKSVKAHLEIKPELFGEVKLKNIEDKQVIYRVPSFYPDKVTITKVKVKPAKSSWLMATAVIVLGAVSLVWWNVQKTNNDEVQQLVVQEPEGSSIAVLPFVNMSSDPEQEYFSDGISEEILNVLAKIPKLQVTSRSSAFAYKGKEINISEVAKVLGVKNVLEGSVRKSGTRVRITSQLINAETDKHLWSESYDRELDDIFKVQDEISAAIVDALRETLDIALFKTAATTQTINPEAYDFYLQGLKGLHTYSFASLAEAVTAFESAIKIAPDFLLARIKLAETFMSQIGTASRFDSEILDTADAMIKDVLVINPESADAYNVRARIADTKGEQELRNQYAKEAYRLNPNNADIIVTHARFNGADIGEEKTRALFNQAQQMDPLNGRIHSFYGIYLRYTLQAYADAEKAYKQAIKVNPNDANYPLFLSRLYSLHMGNLVDAIKQQKIAVKTDLKDPGYSKTLSMLYLSLGDAQKALENAQVAIALSPQYAPAIDTKVNALTYRGQTDKALKLAKDGLDNPDTLYRQSSKVWLTSRAIYLLLKGNKLTEAEALINKHFPELSSLIDAPLPKFASDIGKGRKFDRGLEISLLSTIYQAQGKTEKAQKLAERLNLLDEDFFSEGQARILSYEYIALARISAVQNNNDKAVTYLEAAIDNGYLLDWRPDISQSPFFLSLQQHPRFIALIKRLEAEMVRQRAVIEKELRV